MVWFEKQDLEKKVEETVLDVEHNVVQVQEFYSTPGNDIRIAVTPNGLYMQTALGYEPLRKEV